MEIIRQYFSEIVMGIVLVMGIACAAGLLYNIWNATKKAKKENALLYGFFLASSFLAYGCLVWSKHYSVDSFNLLYDMSPFWHMQLGRYTNCGEILWAEFFGINQVASQQVFLFCWILLMAAGMWLFYSGLADCIQPESTQTKCLIAGATALSFLNVYAMELMLFPEMAMVFLLGNLSLGLAVRYALGSETEIAKWVKSTFFLLIALGCYQSYIGIFEAFVLAGIFLKYKENQKKRYIESAIALVSGGAVSVFDIVLVKMLIHFGLIANSGRGANLKLETILHNVEELLHYQEKFWLNADGLLPMYIMPALGITVLISCVMILKALKRNEQRIYFILLFVGIYILGFAPHLIEKQIDLTPRSNLAIWSVISVAWIIAASLREVKPKQIIRLSECVILLVLFVQVVTMQDMAANEQAMNAIDIMEAKEVAQAVIKYENETGDIISQVASINDVNPTVYQPLSRYRNSQLGARIMVTDYSNYRLLESILGRELKKVDMKEEIYQNYFEGKDWNELLLAEQMYCADSTLYIAIY